MNPELNSKAPDFKLFNTFKKEIGLSEQKGKNVVLLFFPLAFTSTCTKELCSIRDNYAMYNGLNAVVFGISGDSLYSLGKFKEEQKLNFDLLSDFNKDVSTAYGSIYELFGFGMKGVTKRAAFVIDAGGIIKYKEVLENASEEPSYEGITSTLRALIA
ncbi:peroxiredoxin [Aurantibacillus circumpalustris]|uniref:peroxiredoxin n=1 Tax=Aurantibacillus circumpalustris TaxID=3036359 RepID=UPI00295AD5D3|nr:peroxiredoxin [Aurantibacillus circumpalustris]